MLWLRVRVVLVSWAAEQGCAGLALIGRRPLDEEGIHDHAVHSPRRCRAPPPSSASHSRLARPPRRAPRAPLPGTLVPGLRRSGGDHAERRRGRAERREGCSTAKFVVTYTGFTAEAKAAFQRAVNTWAGKLHTTTVPVTVKASWEPLGPGVLGAAGPSAVWDIGGVWNVDAIANKKAGSN